MDLAEATRVAAAEGLALVASSRSATGYQRVYHDSHGTGRFLVIVQENGKPRHLVGNLATVYDGALAYARYLGTRSVDAAAAAAAAERVDMTAQEACQMAQEEGLTLVRTTGAGGFKGVKYQPRQRVGSRRYEAQISEGGGTTWLGCYATAEEAALVFARRVNEKAGEKAARGREKKRQRDEEKARVNAQRTADMGKQRAEQEQREREAAARQQQLFREARERQQQRQQQQTEQQQTEQHQTAKATPAGGDRPAAATAAGSSSWDDGCLDMRAPLPALVDHALRQCGA